jgi:type IV pilus assembly protein PilB
MANIQRMTPKRLGEIFTHSGLITSEQLDEALADQVKSGKHLGELLVERGYVTERDVAEAIATQFSLPYLSPTQYFAPSEMSGVIPVETMKKHNIVPIDKLGKILMVVVAGPVENEVLDQIEKETGSALQVYVGTLTDVRAAIEKLTETSKKTKDKKVI